MQPNFEEEHSVFNRLRTTLGDVERPRKPQEIIIANRIPSKSFLRIGQKLSNYAKSRKHMSHNKPEKLPVMAG